MEYSTSTTRTSSNAYTPNPSNFTSAMLATPSFNEVHILYPSTEELATHYSPFLLHASSFEFDFQSNCILPQAPTYKGLGLGITSEETFDTSLSSSENQKWLEKFVSCSPPSRHWDTFSDQPYKELTMRAQSDTKNSNLPALDGSADQGDVSIGLFPDINMFTLAASEQQVSVGVNPADIFSSSGEWCPKEESPESIMNLCAENYSEGPTTDDSGLTLLPTTATLHGTGTESRSPADKHCADTMRDIISILSDAIINSSMSPAGSPHASDPIVQDVAAPCLKRPCDSPEFFPSPRKRNTSKKTGAKKSDTKPKLEPGISENEPNLGTPLHNLHCGVEKSELEDRARKYRMRNPGEEICQKWLLSFVGKRSVSGEQLPEYRCYIIGCQQRNKRRDHILVHLGAHVGQRPFQCTFCGIRFLRKNECKRHEISSHRDFKPYVCELCPFQEKAFGRQDLLRRHLIRTHRINFNAEKENAGVPLAKRKKVY